MEYRFQGQRYEVKVSEKEIQVFSDGRRLCALRPETAVEYLTPKAVPGVTRDAKGNEIADIYDSKDDVEELTAFEGEVKENEARFVWHAKSSVWAQKVYTLLCDRQGFSYRAIVEGQGRAGEVRYFGGRRPGEKQGVSNYGFCSYYVPICGTHLPSNHLNARQSYRSFFELMIPPMYCFSFRTVGVSGRMGLGMVAKDGEYNFVHFDYNGKETTGMHTGFYLSTDLEGHTMVDGALELPEIRGFFAADDWEVLRAYSDYHYDNGLCRKRSYENVPRWWYGPIVCGWNEQDMLAPAGVPQKEMARQDAYEQIAGMIEEKGLHPTILIIDDKWQRSYGDCLPDENRWPDMRAFTDRMHERGIHTLLWLRLWGGEGLPEDEVMPGEGIPYNMIRLNYAPYADPTNPKYRKHMQEIIYKLLSSDEGCYNCDGFKLDYSLVMPYGKTAKSYGGQYGAQMTKELYKLIYETAKAVKPDALINASPCHPYFAEVCDQTRLHDYSWGNRNEAEQMSERAKLFDIAMPGVLIDTDSANYADYGDCMDYLRAQPEIGVPDIYRFSNSEHVQLSQADWDEIRAIWQAYAARVDRMYQDK